MEGFRGSINLCCRSVKRQQEILIGPFLESRPAFMPWILPPLPPSRRPSSSVSRERLVCYLDGPTLLPPWALRRCPSYGTHSSMVLISRISGNHAVLAE